MKAQKILLQNDQNDKFSWIVVDDQYVPFSPANEYLEHLEIIGKSPNTVRSYAHHVALFFNFLKTKNSNWKEIKFKEIESFVAWLRNPLPMGNITFIHEPVETRRKSSTVNVIIAAVVSFYRYQARLNNCSPLDIYSQKNVRGASQNRPFLHHITKGNSVLKSDLTLKTIKLIPKTVTAAEFKQLVAACRRIRDCFLLCLLYESGIRIGQLLGLRHEDIRTFDNEITVVPRNDNVNFARAKTTESYTIHVTQELMALYGDYLINEFGDIESDYVFVNLWSEPLGRPMNYSAVVSLFKRLKKKTGINIHPHMLRHTHASEFIRAGGRVDIAQRRLGHKSVQTTLNTYTHATNDDMKEAHQNYLEKRNKGKNK